jgi:hypothetical protein
VQAIGSWIRRLGHEGATENARFVLDRERVDLEHVAAVARRVQRLDAERARVAATGDDRAA